MVFFGRKKKNTEIICYEGPIDVLVWKYPYEDFTSETKLIVHESQEAVFFKNGQALDSLTSGEYILNEKNLPLLKRINPFFHDKATPLHSEVYFINKAVSMGLIWGTDTPIEMEEPQYHLPIYVTAHGDFSLRVLEGRKLLGKLVGTTSKFTQEEFQRYFQSIMSSYVRNCIIDVLAESRVRASMAESQLIQISREIHAQLRPVFAEYGLDLNHFVVAGLRVQGMEKIKDIHAGNTETKVTVSGQIDVGRMKDELENERRRTRRNENVADESAKIDLEARRIQLLGEAQNMVRLGGGNVDAQINRQKGITEQERLSYEIEKIRAERGVGNAEDDFEQRLEKLKKAYEKKLISEEIYQEKVQEILNSI